MYVYPRECTYILKERWTQLWRKWGQIAHKINIPITSFAGGGGDVALGNVATLAKGKEREKLEKLPMGGKGK
jgi:hypothetical protein